MIYIIYIYIYNIQKGTIYDKIKNGNEVVEKNGRKRAVTF